MKTDPQRFAFRAAIATAIGLAATTGTARAATKECIGKVQSVTVGSGGDVAAIVIGNGTNLNGQLCSLHGPMGTWTPESCRALLSILQAGLLSKRSVSLYIENTQSCSQEAWQRLWQSPFLLGNVQLNVD